MAFSGTDQKCSGYLQRKRDSFATYTWLRTLLLFVILSAMSLPIFPAVNPDGSYAENLPIVIPNGRGGVQPSLSLNYNSNSPNGVAGVGWSIHGLPAIVRTNNGSGVHFQGNDTYAGPNGRLIDISGNKTLFHPEQENFSKYVPTYGNCGASAIEPCSWTVTDSSGNIMEFGTTSDSQAKSTWIEYTYTTVVLYTCPILGSGPYYDCSGAPPGVCAPKVWHGSPENGDLDWVQSTCTTQVPTPVLRGDDNVVRSWHLNKVMDVHGNFYEVRYRKDSGEIYPAKIIYTQSTQGGISRFRVVEFDYDESSRPDRSIGYGSGGHVETKWRLRDITVKVNVVTFFGFLIPFTGDQVRRYHLSYGTSSTTGRSQLISIQEFGSDDSSSLPPTQFQWQNKILSGLPDNYLPGQGLNDNYTSADVNGDGLQDILWYDAVNKNFRVGLGQPNGTYAKWTWSYGDVVPGGNWRSVDMDGDNRSDLVWKSGSSFHIALAQPDGSFQFWTKINSNLFSSDEWRLTDIDADGNVDLIVYESTNIYVRFGNGTLNYSNWSKVYSGLFSIKRDKWPPDVTGYVREDYRGDWQVIDVNGDGKADLVASDKDGNLYIGLTREDNSFQVWSKVYTATFFVTRFEPYCSGWRNSCPSDKHQYLHFIDANADGVTDILFTERIGENGGGEVSDKAKIALGDGQGNFEWWTQQISPMPEQYRGPGSPDVWTIVSHGQGGVYSRQTKDLITTIIQPSGVTTNIEYKPSYQVAGAIRSDLTSCGGGSGSICGRSYAGARFLVTKLSTLSDMDLDADGAADKFEIAYEYYNGRISTGYIHERQSLGFEKIVTRDVNSGNYKIDTYRQDKPFHGQASVTRSYLANNELISEEISATPQQWLCNESGCVHDQTNNPNPTQPRQLRFSGPAETLTYENGVLIGRKTEQVINYDNYGNPIATKSGVEANGSQHNVYKFTTYLNETNSTRAIGLPVSEILCYSPSECLIGDSNFISAGRVYYDNGGLGTVGARHLATKKEKYVIADAGAGAWVPEEFTYNAAGGVLTTTNAQGITTTTTYDSDYNQFPVNAVKSQGGKSWPVSITYDPRFGKKLTETIVDDGTTTTTIYDATGFAIEVLTKNGSTVLARKTVSRSSPGTSPIWLEECSHFGANFIQARCTKKFTDAIGRIYRNEFPELVNGVETQMAVEHKYDNRGREVQVSQPFNASSGSPTQWNTKIYDSRGRIVQTLNFDGKTTATQYQVTGLPSGIVSCTIATAIDGKQQRACENIYAKTALITESFGTPAETSIQYGYDSRGRLTSIMAPQGATAIGYIGVSDMQAYTDDPVSGRTDFTYYTQPGQPSFGQIATEVRVGNVRSYEYNAGFGRVSKVTRPDSVTTYIYDETDLSFGKNKLTTLSYTVGDYTLQERYSYNAKGDAVGVTRRISHATGALCADADAMPCLQVFGTMKDELGRTQTITYPDGKLTEMSYIGATNQVASIAHAGTNYATYSDYTYDTVPHVGKVTYGNGIEHRYNYQSGTGLLNSLSIGKPSETAHMDFVYGYNPSLNIQSINDTIIPDLSVTYQYDEHNRIRQAAYGSGAIRDFRFDQDGAGNSKGNLLRKGNRRMIYASGKTYPVADELYNEATGLWEAHQTMTWSAAGSLLTKGNFTYEYDSSQMMTKAIEANTAETQFVYDHTGQRFLKKHTRNGVTIKTWYLGDGIELREKYIGISSANSVGLFDSWQATKYVYGIDNKRIASITGNVKNSALAATSSTLFALADSYSTSSISGLAMKTYYTFYGIYAEENFGKVVRITLLSTFALLLLLWLYFNALNSEENFGRAFFQRLTAVVMVTVFVTVNCGQNTPPSGFTQGQINTLISDLYTGLPAGTVYYSHNHLGSGALVTDTNGSEIFRIGYTEYGEIDLENSGKWNEATQTLEKNMSDADFFVVAVKYTGQIFDPETGFYYYNARYYSAELGVFTTSDTEFDEGVFGFNRHMYVRGNPIMYSDPTGHWFFIPLLITVLVGATVGGVAAGTKGNIKGWLDGSQKFDWEAAGKGAAIGAISGAIGFGVGAGVAAGAGALSSALGASAATSATIGTVTGAVFGGAAGGATGAGIGAWQAGYRFGDQAFWDQVGYGALAGAAGGLAAGAAIASGVPILSGFSVSSAIGGSIGNGVSSVLNGGNFWDGFGPGFGFGFAAGWLAGIGNRYLNMDGVVGPKGQMDGVKNNDIIAYQSSMRQSRWDNFLDWMWSTMVGGYSHVGHYKDGKIEQYGDRYSPAGYKGRGFKVIGNGDVPDINATRLTPNAKGMTSAYGKMGPNCSTSLANGLNIAKSWTPYNIYSQYNFPQFGNHIYNYR